MMNGALSVKMNAPLATLEKMLPPVGDPRRAEMQQAIDTLRQVLIEPAPTLQGLPTSTISTTTLTSIFFKEEPSKEEPSRLFL